jgi:hypothetical protein
MKTFNYTASIQSEDFLIIAALGAMNLKTIAGAARKTEKLIPQICDNFNSFKLYFTSLDRYAYYLKIWNYKTKTHDYIRKLSDIIIDLNLVNKIKDFMRQEKDFFIKNPEYHKKDIEFLSCKMFLELRGFDAELNNICIEIENVLNNKKAA